MSEWIISSSVLIILVIALRFVLRGKISLRLQYALWLVVLVRLLMPVSLADSSFSVAGLLQMNRGYELSDIYLWFGDSSANAGGENAYLPDSEWNGEQSGLPGEDQNGVQNDQIGGEHSGNQSGNTDTPVNPEPDMTPDKEPAVEEPDYPVIGGVSIAPSTEKLETSGKGHISLSGILTAIWCAGMAVVAVVLLASNLRFWRNIRKTRWVYEKKSDSLPIYESDVIETPCLFGLICPAIYVTEEVIEDPKMMHHVVAHETTHHAHRDHIWAALRCLCLVLHWYNPLVWWAAALSRRDAELACDEGAIERIGEAVRAEYGRTLIGLTCQGRSHLLSTATTMTGSVKGIKERIMLIANRPKMARYTVMILIVLVVGLIGCTYCGKKETVSGGEQMMENPYEGLEKPYEYPVRPGTDEWAKLDGNQEQWDVCQIPEDVLAKLTTEELLRVVLDCPKISDLFAFSTTEQAYMFIRDNFNGLRELVSRSDFAEVTQAFDCGAFVESLEGNQFADLIEGSYGIILRNYAKGELETEESSQGTEVPTDEPTEEPTTEEPTEESTAPEGIMTPEGLVVPTGYEIKTDILLDTFRQFISYETTKDEVTAIVGLPYGLVGSGNSCGNVYITPEEEMVCVYYTIKRGEYVVDRVLWMYEHEDGYGEYLVQSLNPHGMVIPLDFEIKADITLDMFRKFEARKTTESEIHETVGMPHAAVGFGFVADVYFTSDGYMLAVYCTTVDGARVLDVIEIMNEDGTREELQKNVADGIHTNETIAAGDENVQTIEPGNLHTEETVNASGEIVEQIELGKTILVDLDGDGEQEKLTVAKSYPSTAYYSESVHLQIDDLYCNGDDFDAVMGYTRHFDDNGFYLVDLDTSDKWVEIGIRMTDGAFLATTMRFLRYQDGELFFVGEIDGASLSASLENDMDILIPGDGTVSAFVPHEHMRARSIVKTWELKDSTEFQAVLEEIVPEYYELIPGELFNGVITIKQDMQFFAQKEADMNNLVTLPAGTTVDMPKAYPEGGWIEVVYEDGAKTVWLKVEEDLLLPINIDLWDSKLWEYIVGMVPMAG